MHIVDLDGAATGELQNLAIIKDIATAMLVPTQLGGGIRHLDTVKELLKAGLDRVILGTAAAENPEMVKEVCHNFRESVIIGIDAREGNIATHGWRQETEIDALEFAKSMVRLGVRRFVYTDINRDGTLTEPNFTAIAEFIDAIKLPCIAAGGVSSISHLKVLQKLGAEGAIVGKALYTGDVKLKEAMAVINQL